MLELKIREQREKLKTIDPKDKSLRKNYFKEGLTPYLKEQLEYLKDKYGEDSMEYLTIWRQYIYDEREEFDEGETNGKHYEATLKNTHNIERMYKLHGCMELVFACIAYCRYCLRSNYDGKIALKEEQMIANAKYLHEIGAEEILITGGDPFIAPKKLDLMMKKIIEHAPNIKFIRVATRVFTQDPKRVNDEVLSYLAEANKHVTVEVATQINSHVELDESSEARDAIKRVKDLGIPVYSQNVFLKGVNDTPEQLIQLYHSLRLLGVEAHYLFHSIPMKGTGHLRATVKTMIKCYEGLVNSGKVTGRIKPLMALMTSIGKITLTPFNVIDVDLEIDGRKYVALRSNYKYEDRMSWNPDWELPEEAWVDDEGYLCLNYLDGRD